MSNDRERANAADFKKNGKKFEKRTFVCPWKGGDFSNFDINIVGIFRNAYKS